MLLIGIAIGLFVGVTIGFFGVAILTANARDWDADDQVVTHASPNKGVKLT